MYISIAEVKSRVIDPLVEDTCQDIREFLLNLRDVLEREFALVQLAVKEDMVDYFIDQGRDPGGCRVGEDSRRGLDRIGHHDERRNTGLRFRSGIFKILRRGQLLLLAMFLSLLIKVCGER